MHDQSISDDPKLPSRSSSNSAFSRPITLPTQPPTTTTSTAPPRVPPPTESSRRDLLARLAEKRRTVAALAKTERPAQSLASLKATKPTATSRTKAFEYVEKRFAILYSVLCTYLYM